MKFSQRLARWAVTMGSVLLMAACGGGGQEPAPGAAPALKADVSTFTGHGVYWNPAEPGSGFFFEAQGPLAVVTFYMYETTGRPVWYSASGAFTSTGATTYRFEGQLQRYTGGQSDNSTLSRTPTGAVVGPVTIEFDGFNAKVSLSGRSYNAQKFFQTGAGPTANQPETGVYWIPAENGRGYTIEVRDNVASITVFHYTAAGEPTWNLVTLQLPTPPQQVHGDFTLYQGGQSLNGPHKTPQSSSGGRFSATLDDPCGGRIASPMAGGGLIRRFAFGSLPAGAECRSPSSKAAKAWLPEAGSSSIQYDIATVPEDKGDIIGHLNSLGRLGFKPYRRLDQQTGEQIYIRTDSDRFNYLRTAPVTSDSAEANRLAGEGYRWLGHQRYEDDTYYVRTGNTIRYDYLLDPHGEPWPTTPQFLELLNARGAEGYRTVGLQFGGTGSFRKVYEKDKSFNGRYVYEQAAMPTSEAAFLAALNERGARGFRFVGTRRPTETTPIADNDLLFEKDSTQASSTFSYYRREIPASIWDRLAQLNAEGAKGAILQSVTPIGGTSPAYLYYTTRNCQGLLCQPQRLQHDYLW